MTTTDIQFNEKQEFETIKNIIEIKFENVKIHESISDLKYISFDFKGQNIYCSFMKDNRIYGKNNELTECSSFSSDRPNDIKTEAFRMIAKMFNCKMWENDCNEKDFEIFKAKKLPKPKEITMYNRKKIEQFIKSLNKQDNMKEFLINLNACNDAKEWAEDKTWEEVYNTCHRGDWLLWLFKKTNPDDLQLITLAKGHCANTIRHLMTDERSIAGVDAAIVFGEGKSTREELSGAAAAAYAAAASADAAGAAAAAYAAAYAAASDAAGAAAASAYAAGAGADAKNKNMELTADICRKYLPIDVWNVKSLNKQD